MLKTSRKILESIEVLIIILSTICRLKLTKTRKPAIFLSKIKLVKSPSITLSPYFTPKYLSSKLLIREGQKGPQTPIKSTLSGIIPSAITRYRVILFNTRLIPMVTEYLSTNLSTRFQASTGPP